MLKEKDKVKVDYILEVDGKIIDTTFEDVAKKNDIFNNFIVYEPLEFEIGSGVVIRGFDKAIREMKKGEEKEVIVDCKDGYGERSEKLVLELDREKFKHKEPINVNDKMILNLPNKRRIDGKIIEVKDDKVKLDCNHDLSG
ncbi:peptidylprolyl isomerase, partial [archaeon]|nr:peptidylprolyl isomerase [archaeon]